MVCSISHRFTVERDPWYFTVDDTRDGSNTHPFAQTSFTFVNVGDAYFTLPNLHYGGFADLTFGRANNFLEREPIAVTTRLRDLIVVAGDFRLGTSEFSLEV